MKKICYVAPDVPIPSPRGSSVHVRELAQNLSLLGNEVHVICRRNSSSEKKEEKLGLYTLHRVNRWIFRPGPKFSAEGTGHSSSSGALNRFYYLYLLTIFKFYVSLVASRIIAKYNLDIILERETSFGAGSLASRFTGKPMLLEIIGPRYSKSSAKRANKILYYTESMLREWVDRSKCVSIPAGVNLDLFRQDDLKGLEVRSSLNFETSFLMGYVGTFQTWHGIDTLLRATKLVRAICPDLRLLLIGPNSEPYRIQAENLGLSDIVKFLGAMEYELIPNYTNACNVMLALYEPKKDPVRSKYGIGWPIKILEYMACGKPTISTKVEPVTKIITSSEIGLLVEPGNEQELANLIASIHANRDNLENIGMNGKELVVQNYSWASVARTISELMTEESKVLTESTATVSKPLVSIIVPAYNEEKEIANALAEMKKQTYSNTELIVVDDGSTDRTREAAATSGGSIPNFQTISIKHSGPSAARNAGITSSKGDIVFFAECDCVYDSDYIEKAVEALNRKPEAGAVCLTGAPLNVKSTLATDPIDLENQRQHKLLKEGKMQPFYAWVYRRSALEKTHGFDETLFQAEDRDLFRRVKQEGYKIAWVPGINWRHKRSETLSELSSKWFARGKTRVLFVLKHKLFSDLARTLLPLWAFVIGLLLLPLSLFGGVLLLLLVLLLFCTQSARIVSYVKPTKTTKLSFVYPFFLIVRNFSSGAGYTYGLLRFVLLKLRRQEITHESI